ncbi:uncharacterized protein BCR38DRAFT_439429 [Pseudomassariella vexata]|uniref:MARVEL domain-containing protein n=1 Tax=Pseudomassariella vexata TaxID=1141098 RepID=A0A1Y2DU22_9PEZI|nr:uncharacterized protein BCR38DRAFT_439429 [Pseudomassariella vexata]ORY62669.1 hypothetical protein BCR38DRAFT_439429 [Pseudomassariella vexata]
MAKWGLSTWLVFVRLLQVLAAIVSAGLNGFLLVYIHVNRLGLSQAMSTLEIMTCVVLIYTAIVLLVQHTGRRRIKAPTNVVATFVVGDVIFTGLMIGVITILARTGVPSNCQGLTTSESDDAPNKAPKGYNTIGFGDGSSDKKGMLDKWCALERGYYFISVAVIFSYMVTVTLSILRICEGLYTKNTEVDQQLISASELQQLKLKPSKDSSRRYSPVLRARGGGFSSPSPVTEGVSSPRSTTSRQSTGQSFRHQARRPTLPVSPLTSPTITIDPAREGLLIQQQQHTVVVEEDPAEAAAVADGFRPQQLNQAADAPPSYTPGSSYRPGESSSCMVGHARESNEMRLSEYVKGETRAQDLKDRGGL